MTTARRTLLTVMVLLLTGCASVSHHVPDWLTPDKPLQRHDSVRDEATVARMRAAPPREPELSAGHDFVADQSAAAARGEVRIGTGFFVDDGYAERHALAHGRMLGADHILLYRDAQARAAGALPNEDFAAAYYVQFRLLFGATFRDLTAHERAARGGGVQVGKVIHSTPAALANLMAGDIILAVNGQTIADKQQFQRALNANQGETVTMKVWRNGEAIDRIVTLGAATSS